MISKSLQPGSAFFLASMCFTVMSCFSQEIRFDRQEIFLTGRSGEIIVNAEIASNDRQRERGLMHRESLHDGEGMLFIFEQEQLLSFWMKDTIIPLSIAFISVDGKIQEIYDMAPLNLSPVSSKRPAMYALEVPQNWFERAGIRTGDHLLVDRINRRL